MSAKLPGGLHWGKFLKRRRVERELTQRQFGALIENARADGEKIVHPQHLVSRYEKTANPSANTIFELLRLLGYQIKIRRIKGWPDEATQSILQQNQRVRTPPVKRKKAAAPAEPIAAAHEIPASLEGEIVYEPEGGAPVECEFCCSKVNVTVTPAGSPVCDDEECLAAARGLGRLLAVADADKAATEARGEEWQGIALGPQLTDDPSGGGRPVHSRIDPRTGEILYSFEKSQEEVDAAAAVADATQGPDRMKDEDAS
jgi:transcriptional regulator with XRE-family HTH domain